MLASAMTGDESQRLDELRRYQLFDEGDAALVRLVELAARLCETPLAAITFVGERSQRLVARWGLPAEHPNESPIDSSFCNLALHQSTLLISEDTAADSRFSTEALVAAWPRVRFYAGAPLRTPLGHALGTLCVLDYAPRSLSDLQARTLQMMRDEVMELFETRRELLELRRSEALRQEAVEALLAAQNDLKARVELRTREVEEAHRRTRQLLERIGDAFIALDRNWSYIYVNERAAELFGRTPAGLVGKHIWTEFPEGVGQPFHAAYERAMSEQVAITLEACYEPWGRWFENRIYPSPEGISVFFTEITERRRAEQALQMSRARLIEAQRVAHVGSWEWDVAANSVLWSDELYRIYGVAIGTRLEGYEGFLARVHRDDSEQTKQVIGQALAAGTPFAYDHRIVRPDGSIRMLHTRGEAILVGDKVARLVGSCWDVTELHTTTEQLTRTVALLEATLQVTSDGLLVVDENGQVVTFNERFVALFALPAELTAKQDSAWLLGWLESQLAAPRPFMERMRALAADQSSVDMLRLIDGRQLEARSTPQRVEGNIIGRVWSVRELKPADA
ncbi:MAG: domain S-box [Myxococcales bacterium]|nr:domain S-box [Myxococcales bacterium]